MNIEKRFFGKAKGQDVDLYTLTVDSGTSVSITNFGGTIVKLMTLDKFGRLGDIVCGYDDLSHYIEGDGYQGALVGRIANRIANGKFTLDGKEYNLYINNGKNHLHGGKEGFSYKVWDAVPEIEEDGCSLTLSYTSPDGEENYPGTLNVTVKYKLTQDNALSIYYRATTDKKTILNLTNHSYFNLGGYASGKVFDHELKMDVESFLELGEGLIPTGKILPVANTPFDFTSFKTIGKDFDIENEYIKIANGYDHCLNFVKRENPLENPRVIAKESKSGRVMELYTDMPCVQLYTGNFLNNADHPFKGGYPQNVQCSFCLETQKMPDSINHENFTDCTLDVGEVFESTTVFKFSIEK